MIDNHTVGSVKRISPVLNRNAIVKSGGVLQQSEEVGYVVREKIGVGVYNPSALNLFLKKESEGALPVYDEDPN